MIRKQAFLISFKNFRKIYTVFTMVNFHLRLSCVPNGAPLLLMANGMTKANLFQRNGKRIWNTLYQMQISFAFDFAFLLFQIILKIVRFRHFNCHSLSIWNKCFNSKGEKLNYLKYFFQIKLVNDGKTLSYSIKG